MVQKNGGEFLDCCSSAAKRSASTNAEKGSRVNPGIRTKPTERWVESEITTGLFKAKNLSPYVA